MKQFESSPSSNLQSVVDTTIESLRGYAVDHQDQLHGIHENVTKGVISKSEEGKIAELIVGEDPRDVLEAKVGFVRGMQTRRGNDAVDLFVFKPGESLVRHSGEHMTELVTIDPETGEASFAEGIGPKRQKLAIAALRIIEDNITNDYELVEA